MIHERIDDLDSPIFSGNWRSYGSIGCNNKWRATGIDNEQNPVVFTMISTNSTGGEISHYLASDCPEFIFFILKKREGNIDGNDSI